MTADEIKKKPAPIRLLVFDDRVEIISPGALPNNLTVEDIKLGNAYQRNQLIATLCAKTMDYRGLGSGIIRALQSDNNIEFRNEVSGDQFRVILWRSNLKSKEKTTQKTTQKTDLIGSEKTEDSEKNTQKTDLIGSEKAEGSDKTTQKTDLTGSEKAKGSEKTTQKTIQVTPTHETTTQKIISLISEHPDISRDKLAQACGVTSDAIKLQIRKLRKSGKIRRVGPDKGGHWEIC